MYQQIILIGNLGGDAELRFTPSGVPVASFSLGVNREWNNANGERQKKTTWFRCSLWNKPAESLTEYLVKGKQVMVVGEIEEARVFTDRDGNPRASLEVKVLTIRLLGGRQQQGDPTDAITVEGGPEIPF
jgi:single-strand DNA-binding protein